MKKLIEDIQAVGIYDDTIRIVPKNEEPINLERSKFRLRVENNIERIDDVRLGHEHRVLISFTENSVNCYIDDEHDTVYCGENPQSW